MAEYKKEVVVVVSGGFDPIHVGHVRHFKAAKELGTWLYVILDSDDFLIAKKGRAFMPFEQRKEIIQEFACVDMVVPVLDRPHRGVEKTLDYYEVDIFANGGDRTSKNIPEYDFCEEHSIVMRFDIGGDKIESSSSLLNKYAKHKKV